MSSVDQADVPQPPSERYRVDALLAEYASLRQESLQAITNRLQVLSFTFAALSVVVAATLTGRIPRLAAAGVLVVFVPVMAKASLLVWLGEYGRSQRAGRWIAGLETRINAAVGQGTVGWESRLISRGAHMRFPYGAVVGLLLGTGYVAYGLGIYFLASYSNSHHRGVPVGVMVCLSLGCVAVEVAFLAWLRRTWRGLRSRFAVMMEAAATSSKQSPAQVTNLGESERA